MRRRRKRIIQQEQPVEQESSSEFFLLCSDDHIRSKTPKCRLDDFQKSMFDKLEYRNKIAIQNNVKYCLNAGDIGHEHYFVKGSNTTSDKTTTANGWSASLFYKFADYLDTISHKILCVAGNHDLPGHDIKNISESVFGSLIKLKNIDLLTHKKINKCNIYGVSWNEEIPEPEIIPGERNILVIHKMVIKDIPLWPGQEAPNGYDMIKKYPMYDLIVSGDNHNTFVQKQDNRILVNPGSMLRLTAAQTDHKPCMFLYYPETNTIKQVFYKITPSEESITRKHIDKKQSQDIIFEQYANSIEQADFSKFKTLDQNIQEIIDKQKSSKDIIKLIQRLKDTDESLIQS